MVFISSIQMIRKNIERSSESRIGIYMTTASLNNLSFNSVELVQVTIVNKA